MEEIEEGDRNRERERERERETLKSKIEKREKKVAITMEHYRAGSCVHGL